MIVVHFTAGTGPMRLALFIIPFQSISINPFLSRGFTLDSTLKYDSIESAEQVPV